MKWTIIFAFIVTFSLNYCSAKQLPSYIKRCKLADPVAEVSNCIRENALSLLPRLTKPNPELRLPSVEPLRIPKLEINSGNSNANAFAIIFNDADLYGVKDAAIKEFIFDIEKPHMSFHAYIPQLYCRTSYSIDGKILVLELHSKGKAVMNLTNIEAKIHHTNMSIVTRKGKRYLHLEDSEVDYFNYKKGYMYLEDIFKDNQELTEQTNKLINDSFDEIAKEVNPLLFDAIRLLLLSIIKPIFNDYSLDELFE